VRTGDEIYRFERSGSFAEFEEITAASFSPARSHLTTGSIGGEVSTWDLQSGEQVAAFSALDFAPIFAISYGPTGDLLATGGSCFGTGTSVDVIKMCPHIGETTLRAWNPITGEEALVGHIYFPFSEGIRTLAFSPDGELIAAGSTTGLTRIISVRTGQLQFDLASHTREVTGVAFSPDGSRIATVSLDGIVKLWQLGDAYAFEELRLGQPATTGNSVSGALALNNDGSLLVNSHGLAVQVWNAHEGTSTNTLVSQGSGVVQVSLSPAGEFIAALDESGTFRLWNSSDGSELLSLPGFYGCCFAFTENGKSIVITTSSSSLTVFDFATLLTQSHSAQAILRVLRLGSTARTAGSTSTTELFGSESIIRISSSPVGDIIALSADGGLLRLIHTATGEQLHILDSAASVSLGIAFSADGESFATAGSDGKVRVLDTLSGKIFLTLEGHSSAVNSVTFSRDATMVATASQDGTAKVFDATTGAEIISLSVTSAGVADIAFSPDGTRLYALGLDGVIKVYALQVDRLIELAELRLTRSFTTDECQRYLHMEACPPEG
jgi:WD40 repeat protein